MIISCENCQARFRLADEKLKPGGTRVRCSKCQHIFTVIPPAPVEEVVDFGAFNMERVSDEEASPSPPGPAPSAGDDVTATESGSREFDFGVKEAASEPEAAPPPAGDADAELAAGSQPAPPHQAEAAAGTEAAGGEFRFDEEPADQGETARETSFVFPAADETAAPTEFEFDRAGFPAVPADAAPGEPAGEADSEAGQFAFDEPTEAEVKSEDFAFGEEGEPPLFEDKLLFGEEETSGWEEPGSDKGSSFDFDAPSFAGVENERPADSGGRAALNFGEIDLGDDQPFAPPPESAPAGPSQPATTEPPPPPTTPPQGMATARPRPMPPLPAMPPARKSTSRVFLLLILLLLLLAGAGAYFYLQGDGQQLVERLMVTLKGEQVAAPVEQRIGLTISGSSYVDNREVGQLLVIQGTATNNFSGARSAIAVKGVLVDADGKVLQQQTVFCGNYLSEEKLRTMRYAQIEEAMNNQFGDSLANMNVKPGSAIRFTVVFRNLPQNLANINVEVVDSKPGGL